MTTHSTSRTLQPFPVAETFGIAAPAGLTVPGYPTPGPLTPAPRSDFTFRPTLLRDLLPWYQGLHEGRADGLWLLGPTGAGKSSLVVELCARLNRDLLRVTGRRHLELADLIGHLTVIGGDVLFQDGPLTLALRHGWLLLIDEVDLIEPGELAGLNTVLDGGPLVIAENSGEVVWPAPGFGLVCTANTGGNGDRAGLYLGTQRMNGAFMDRFTLMQVDYPEPAAEQVLLHRACPALPTEIGAKMIEVANEVRRLFQGEADSGSAIEVTLSTRTLIRWAHQAVCYRNAPQPLAFALDRALLFRAEPETRAAVLGIVQRVFGEEASDG